MSQSVGLVPGDEYQLVILDSVGDYCGYGDRFRCVVLNCGRPDETSWSSCSLTTGARVAASGFNEVTEYGYLSSHSVGLVPTDEYQLVILDSVAEGKRKGLGELLGESQLKTYWAIKLLGERVARRVT
jgi:hypothetical protein